MKDTNRYALLVIEVDIGEYAKINCRAVRICPETNTPLNMVNINDNPKGLLFHDLVVSCQINVGISPRAYGFQVSYHEPFRVEEREATRMVATFRKLNRKMKALDEAAGTADTFGAYVARVCSALGFESVWFTSKYNGTRYSDCEYLVESPYNAQFAINDKVIKLARVPETT